MLTEAGLAHLAKQAPAHVEEVRKQVFDVLEPAQVAAMSEALGRVLAQLDPGNLAAPNGSCLAAPEQIIDKD